MGSPDVQYNKCFMWFKLSYLWCVAMASSPIVLFLVELNLVHPATDTGGKLYWCGYNSCPMLKNSPAANPVRAPLKAP